MRRRFRTSEGLLRGPKFWDLGAHGGLASSYIMLGREKEARSEAAEVIRINPRFTIEGYIKPLPLKVNDQSKLDKYIATLRKAGLK